MTAQVVHFVKPPQVRALSSQVFTKREVAQAFETPETKIEMAASRFGMFLISEPLVGATRRYHYLDCLALLVWLSFDRQWGPSGRKTLTSQVSHLLFGEHVTAEEYRARRAETRKQYDKAVETPRGLDEFGDRMRKILVQRREEIRQDFWSSNPLWWSRSADVNFVIFGTAQHQLITGVYDRRETRGVSYEELAQIRAQHWINATQWFCHADARLAAILEQREPADA
jgi:hypothetical protein